MNVRSSHAVGVLVVAFALLPVAACGRESEPTSDLTDRAREIVEDTVAMRFDEVRSAFDPRIAANLPVEALRKAWNDFLAEHGAVREIGDAETVERDGITIVAFPLEMAKKPAEARITFAPSGKVAGLDFVERGTLP